MNIQSMTYKLVFVLVIIVIILPSSVDIISHLGLSINSASKSNDEVYKIAVIHKKEYHKASAKQWNTIKSAANYFTNNGVVENEFSLLGNRYEFIDLYEDSQLGNICETIGNTPNDLKNVIAILGPITSSCTLSMLEKNNLNIPIITSFATGPNLNINDKDFFFRTVPNDNFRVAKLLEKWNTGIARGSIENDLIIYDSENPYSKPSYDLVNSFIDEESDHQLFAIDITHTSNPDLHDDVKFNTVFVMLSPESVKDIIGKINDIQYTKHQRNRPKYVAKTEVADTKLFSHPGSLIAMTPTLVSYNILNDSNFLNVKRDQLQNRSASSFLAFEVLFRALEYVSNNGLGRCTQQSDTTSQWRCAMIERLNQPFRSELIGNEIKFNKTGDIETHLLVDAEIRELGTDFTLSSSDRNSPTLVSILLDGNQKSSWLGSPQNIIFNSNTSSEITARFDYMAPEWIRFSLLRKFLNSALSYSKNLTTTQTPYQFHPWFIGTYSIQLTGLSLDLRQSPGKHELIIGPPVHLFYTLMIALLVATIVTMNSSSTFSYPKWKKIGLEAALSSLFLYFMTVTLRGYEVPLAPTLSFSDNAVTNTIYCGIIAGTIRLRIFKYFITPIMKRFSPESQTAQSSS